MTLTIELTPDEELRVIAAKARGIDVTSLLRGVISGLPACPPADRTKEIFAQWAVEDEERLAQMTPEEIEAEDAGWDEIMHNIQHNRVNFPVPELSDHD